MKNYVRVYVKFTVAFFFFILLNLHKKNLLRGLVQIEIIQKIPFYSFDYRCQKKNHFVVQVARLIRSRSSARFTFELSENLI